MKEDVGSTQRKYGSDFAEENFALFEIKKDKYFNFETIDPDSFKTDLFCSVINRAIELFAENKVVMYCPEYRRKNDRRKKWFIFPEKPAKFRDDGALSKIKKEFEEKGLVNGIFADVIKEEKRTHKYLCILQEGLDIELIQKTDVSYKDEGTTGIEIIIFPNRKIIRAGNDEETVQSYFNSEDFIIRIRAERLLTRSYIKINAKHISAERVKKIFETAASEYGKKIFALDGGTDWIGYDW